MISLYCIGEGQRGMGWWRGGNWRRNWEKKKQGTGVWEKEKRGKAAKKGYWKQIDQTSLSSNVFSMTTVLKGR